jgi:hypothetical protein
MQFFNLINRHNLKAAGTHLIISAVIALLSLVLVYGLWYPAPLDAALGVGAIFLMLLGIDITLGPLLTLVVYKPLKSNLKFDLSVIACVQLAALLYGLYTVGSARPAYLVFTKDRFDLVQAHEVASLAGSKAKPELMLQSAWAQPLWGYSVAAAQVPTQPEYFPLLDILMNTALSGGPDVPNVLDLRVSYAQVLPKIQATALPLANLKPAKAELTSTVKDWQSKYPAGSAVVPLKIKFTIYTVVLNPSSGEVLGIEPVDVF